MVMPFDFETSAAFALAQDEADPLAGFKKQFHFPLHEGKEVIYFCGNSLGLQPRTVEQAIATELDTWRRLAVEGYFEGPHPWLYYQDYVSTPLSRLVGALPQEVTVMNALTVNLHLLMQSFYRPSASRFKIIMEAGAFPSDQYAVETQVKQYGLRVEDAVIEVAPRAGEQLLREADILQAIEQHKHELALVLFGGIHYYTGQLLDIPSITAAAHAAGAIAGWDLAHVTGNVPVSLHDWDVDFAVWCSYKYLNGGPGAVGGVFVHERHALQTNTPRLAGWWGNEEATRFRMEKGFAAKPGAAGWNLSTAQVFNTVALKASLELFEQTSITALYAKSRRLTAYLEFLLRQLRHLPFELITPADSFKRGAQLSLYFRENAQAVHRQLSSNGVVVDYREPGVIRAAPAPLYNSYQDVYRFFEILKNCSL
jgi:kynureninase